jgi:hypothetical protein
MPDATTVSRERARLVKEADPGDALFFHYNPTEWSDGYSADWAAEDASGAGTALPTLTYKGGKGRNIKFSLFLNEFGQREPIRQTVSQALDWLFKSASPVGQSTKEGSDAATPPVLLLLRGGRAPFRCVLTNFDIKEQMFKPQTMEPTRATVDVELAQYVDTPEELSSAAAGPRTSGEPAIASKQDKSPFEQGLESGYKSAGGVEG